MATLYEDKTDTGQVGRLDRPRTTLCSDDERIDAVAGKCLACTMYLNAMPYMCEFPGTGVELYDLLCLTAIRLLRLRTPSIPKKLTFFLTLITITIKNVRALQRDTQFIKLSIIRLLTKLTCVSSRL